MFLKRRVGEKLFDGILSGDRNKEPGCSTVIVAAGNSTRMGDDKLFMQLGEMPVLARTLLAYENCRAVEEIVVVTRSDKLEEVADMCKKYGISKASKVIIGGKTRVESSLAGVSEVKENAEIIAIHDGARPFITAETIENCVEAAAHYLAAAPAVPCTDTLKAVNDRGYAIGTVDRSTTFRVQTPQVFQADLIKGALTRAVEKELPITDDCSAVETMGVKCYMVEGDEDNIKLTTARDMMIAEAIMQNAECCGGGT